MEQEPENTVYYELYKSAKIDPQIIHDLVQTLLPQEHLFNNFNIRKIDSNENIAHGSADFTDNIEIEWLVVYVLFELSKRDSDLVIKVFDKYGDILLIEAAEHLPRWLESSKSKNRVFIHKGKLHIIPEQIKVPDLQQATKFIRDTNSIMNPKVRTLADSKIQDAIREQLSGLPDTKVWMQKKFKQLDEIISENSEHLQQQFNESLNLASVMAMNDADLQISPISSLSASSSSSSSWLTLPDDDNDECDRK